MAATYRENGKKCRVTYAKEAISQFSPIAQLMAKNGPYTQAINEQYKTHFTLLFTLNYLNFW